MRKPVIATLLALCAACAFGQATASARKTITVSIPAFVSVTFDNNAALTFKINDGGAAHSYSKSATFLVRSNVSYTVQTAAFKPRSSEPGGAEAPGIFTATSDLAGATHGPTTGQAGVLTVTISGLDLNNATKGLYTIDGSTVVTVTEAG